MIRYGNILVSLSNLIYTILLINGILVFYSMYPKIINICIKLMKLSDLISISNLG